MEKWIFLFLFLSFPFPHFISGHIQDLDRSGVSGLRGSAFNRDGGVPGQSSPRKGRTGQGRCYSATGEVQMQMQ